MPPTEYADLLVVLDLLGIFVFSVTGALVAVRKNLDLFAAAVLAGVTGLGGGFLRDVLIGATPPAALADWRYLMVSLAAGLLTFAFHPAIGRLERVVTVLDAVGLALFCVTGALKAVDYGLGPLPAALMGMVTGIGGGIMRDVLAGRVPVIFEGVLYATPALAGAARGRPPRPGRRPAGHRRRGRLQHLPRVAAARARARVARAAAQGPVERLRARRRPGSSARPADGQSPSTWRT